MLLQMTLFHSFCDWVVFYCVYTHTHTHTHIYQIHLFYPLIWWWTFRFSFFFLFLGQRAQSGGQHACPRASLCRASGSHSRGRSKALPQQDRFSTDCSRNHPNLTLSGEREEEPQAGCGGQEERQKGQRGPETSPKQGPSESPKEGSWRARVSLRPLLWHKKAGVLYVLPPKVTENNWGLGPTVPSVFRSSWSLLWQDKAGAARPSRMFLRLERGVRQQGGGPGTTTCRLSVAFLFISLLLTPQWRGRRISWNRITETRLFSCFIHCGFQNINWIWNLFRDSWSQRPFYLNRIENRLYTAHNLNIISWWFSLKAFSFMSV